MNSTIFCLTQLFVHGGHVARVEDRVAIRGPRSALPPDLVAALRERTDELTALLENPRQAAQDAWEATVTDVAAEWNRLRKAHGKAPWLTETRQEKECVLTETVGAAIRAADLPAALRAMARWRRGWLGFLDEATKSPDADACGEAPGSGEPPRIRGPP